MKSRNCTYYTENYVCDDNPYDPQRKGLSPTQKNHMYL